VKLLHPRHQNLQTVQKNFLKTGVTRDSDCVRQSLSNISDGK